MNDYRNDGMFKKPVTITLSSGCVKVATTREAAALLLYKWPTGETGPRAKARMVCMKALGGGSTPEDAREAFVGAAKEAHILQA